MKILVTGGCGFIGSAVVRLAVARGHEVVNLDALTYAGCRDNVADVAAMPGYAFEYVDIRNRTALDDMLEKHRPDAVLHLAAESHVDRSIDGPSTFIESNIAGTFNLLEAARHYWTRRGNPDCFRFLHLSTDEVFGSLPYDPGLRFTEKSAYCPRSPYAASKAAADHLVRSWHETYGLPVLLTNCSNNYGPFQFPEKLVPVVILKVIALDPLPVYGDGSNVRDWLYVEDHADALLLVMRNGRIGCSYNIGSDGESSNLALVHEICAILDARCPKKHGSYADQITFAADRPGHDARYAIDQGRICNELGWQATMSLKEGLERTVDWYIANDDWWRPLLARNGVDHRLGLVS